MKNVKRAVSFTMALLMAASLTFVNDASSVKAAENSGIESGAVYKLINKQSGKALDVSSAATNDGANVQQWSDNGGSQQQWKVEDTGDGYYKLTAQHSGKVLDVEGGYTNDGANVQQWSDLGNSHQKWQITATSDGYYKLICQCSGKALDVVGGYTNDGANVQQWSDNGNTQQNWQFVKISDSGKDSGKDTGDSDRQAPSVPAGLTTSEISKTSVTLSWEKSSDNVGVSGYEVYLNGELKATVQDNRYTFTGLEENTTYKLSVLAKDAAGNQSAGAETSATTLKTESPQPVSGGFHTDGTALMDANGRQFIIRGINYSYAWQQGHEGVVIPAIKATGANTVRIQISDGTQWSKTSLSELQSLIQLCEKNKLICILEVQDELGSNQISDLQKAADYWCEMKSALAGHESTVILNIANEWGQEWESSNWCAGYTKVIPEIRNAGIKNTIMVDCAGYGQYPKSIADKGKEVAASDSLGNIMFSIHMYEYCGGTDSQVKSNIDNALNAGVPLCIGEFGYKHKDGPVAYQTIKDYCAEKSVGYCGWSWTGNGGGVEFLDMFSDYAGTTMLENGRDIIEGTNGIKETSVECSVFGSSTGSDTQAPSVPQNVAGTAESYHSVKLTWDASTDNTAVKSYNIYQDGKLVDVVQTDSCTVSKLKAATAYSFAVSALDAAGNESGKSSTVTVTTADSNDKTAPTAVTALKVKTAKKAVTLSWNAATDNISVAFYNIYQDGKKVADTQKTSVTVSDLKEKNTYVFKVTAVDDAGNESEAAAITATTNGSETQTVDPGMIADYKNWYVGINGASKKTSTTAVLSSLDNGGLNMTFDLQKENYPCFQLDPAKAIDMSTHKTMTLVVTNPNLKSIQVVPIIKDNINSDSSWKELCKYTEILPKTTAIINVPLTSVSEASHVERFILRVQTGNGGFAGSVQLHTISFDAADGAFDTAVAEMNRPKSADYYAWDYQEASFSKTTKAGIRNNILYVDYSGVTDTDTAGISTKNNEMSTNGQDWSSYSGISATITNTGKKAVHVSLVLRTGGGWIWQESGGQTADDDQTERIIKPGESVDVVYDFNKTIWKSAKTDWKNTAKLTDSDKVLCTQFKVYAASGEAATDGSVEISNFSVDF